MRSPLTTSLMFLESILGQNIGVQAKRMVMIVIAQINLLLASVNDMLDLRLIEENKFRPKIDLFSPKETFKFILSMFQPLS